MKTGFLKLAAAAALFAPLPALAAPALAGDVREITRDGVTYRYTVAEKGAKTSITGTSSEGGAYRLHVSGRRISGVVNGKYVAFTMADVERTARTAEVASR